MNTEMHTAIVKMFLTIGNSGDVEIKRPMIVVIKYSVEPYVEAKLSGPPEDCYPAEGGTVYIEDALMYRNDDLIQKGGPAPYLAPLWLVPLLNSDEGMNAYLFEQAMEREQSAREGRDDGRDFSAPYEP